MGNILSFKIIYACITFLSRAVLMTTEKYVSKLDSNSFIPFWQIPFNITLALFFTAEVEYTTYFDLWTLHIQLQANFTFGYKYLHRKTMAKNSRENLEGLCFLFLKKMKH